MLSLSTEMIRCLHSVSILFLLQSRPLQQPTTHTIKQTNKRKKAYKIHSRSFAFIFIHICIGWRLLIRYCTVSILESWIKMIWNFDLQESRMTTFSLVVLPIFMKITTYIYLCVCAQCAMRIVRELTFDESQSQPVDETLNERDNRKKNIKNSNAFEFCRRLFSFHFLLLHSVEIFHLDGMWCESSWVE